MTVQPLIADDLSTANGLVNFQTLCETFEACQDSGGYRANAIVNEWTLQEFITRVTDYFPVESPAWASWCRTDMGAMMDDAVRIEFSRIAAFDPRTAAQLDIDLTNASVAEHAMLRAVWHSAYNGGTVLFPTIENEVATGVIVLVAI